MVGNDIVDLAEACKTSKWRDPRFLNKLFTKLEQKLIRESINPYVMIWRLWSMKEATYKLYTQSCKRRFFNPKGFECFIENNSGKVRFNDFKCSVVSQVNKDFILSEARPYKDNIKSKVITFANNCLKTQSQQLKKELLDQFSTTLRDSSHLQLKYTALGVPFVLVENSIRHVSLTHHGRFGAFAIA